MGTVLPILQALAWDVFDADTVRYDEANFAVALRDGQARPQLFLEIHGARFDSGTVPGLLSRARRAGVSLVVLTNGPAWRLYVAEAEADSASRVFKLDPCRTESSESAATLCRYLGRHRVLNGAAAKDAIGANTNTSKREQEARAGAAVAGLEFGTDVIVDFRSP